MDIAKALDGKYFINQLQSQQGTQLLRGRILGPIGSEHSPYYLCELFPANVEKIGITTQTLLSLEQLSGVYLYEDKGMQDAAWAELQRELAAFRARQATEEEHGPHLRGVTFSKLPPALAEALGIKPPPDTDEPGQPDQPPDKDKR